MAKNMKNWIGFIFIFLALLPTFSCKNDESNQPPATPLIYTPANNDTNVSVKPTMIWTACNDPENDSVTYEVYLGITSPPLLVKSNISLNKYIPDTLKNFTKYYWKVVAKDNKNNSSTSSIFTFTTGGKELPLGNLNVFIVDSDKVNYYGGAEVFLYKSEAERNADNQRNHYYRVAYTSNTDPVSLGAMFYELANQKYYLFARRDLGGGNFLPGTGESFVPAGVITKLVISIQ
jgi:hypothetical protein